MAYAFVRQQENSLTSAASSVSTGNWAANPTAGNLIWVVATATTAGVTLSTPTDNIGNTYTLIGSCSESSVTTYHWYAKNVSTGGIFNVTVATTSGTDRLGIYASEWSGLDTTAPLDGHSELGQNPGSSGANVIVSGSATNSWTPGVIVAFGFDRQGAVQTAGTSPIAFTALTKVWNQLGQLANQGLPEYASVSTSSSKQATIGNTNFDRHNMVMAIFKESGATSAGTTLALTGASATASRGALVSAVSKTPTGSAATASAGSVKSSITVALTGVGATASQGALAGSASAAMSGQAANTSLGTVAASISDPLSGQGSSYALGSVQTALALTGQGATFSQGSVAVPATTALTGQQATTSQGTATAAVSSALSGQGATTAQTAPTAGVSAPLSGQATGAALGLESSSVSYALTGVSGAYQQGSVTATGATTLALSGQQASTAQGAVSPAVTSALVGSSATGQAGVLSSAPGLSGQSETALTGALGPSVSIPLTGQSSVWQTGNIIVPGDVTLALTGIGIAYAQGQLGLVGLVPAGHGSREKEKRRVGLEINGKIELFESPEDMRAWLDAQKPKKAKAVVRATKALAQKLVATPGFSAFAPGDFKGATEALAAYKPIYAPQELAEIASAIEDEDDDEEALMLMLNHEREMLAMLAHWSFNGS